MAVKNLVGEKFGRWVVLKKAPSRNGASYWKCRCDCGVEKEVKGQSLTSGKSQSCGCYKKDFWTKDISNQRFGRLIALSNTGKTSSNHYVIWQCKCDCGNVCEVDLHSLQKGNTKSCGCLRKERAAAAVSEKCRINLLGRTFGQLTVVADMGSVDGKTYWKCKCGCGNEIVTRTEYLQSGHKNSCGCLKESVGELNVRLFLEKANIKYKQITQASINSLILPLLTIAIK